MVRLSQTTPAGGHEELGGVSHSERMMADMLKMLANLTMQDQQLLQQHLQQQQQTAAAAGDRGLQQQMAAGEGGHVKESGGAREGCVLHSSGLLVKETTAKLDSLYGKGRQASLARSYPGFRVAGQAPVADVPRRDGQRGEGGTIRGFGPEHEAAAMFDFGPDVSGMNSSGYKPTIPVFNCKQELFSWWKQESVIYFRWYDFDGVFTSLKADECQDVNVGDPDYPVERLQDEFGADIGVSYLNVWQFLSSALKSEK